MNVHALNLSHFTGPKCVKAKPRKKKVRVKRIHVNKYNNSRKRVNKMGGRGGIDMLINSFKAEKSVIYNSLINSTDLVSVHHCYVMMLNKLCDLDMLSRVFGPAIDKLRNKYLAYVPTVLNFPANMMGTTIESFITTEPYVYLEHTRVGIDKFRTIEGDYKSPILNVVVNKEIILSFELGKVSYCAVNYLTADWHLVQEQCFPELLLEPLYQFKSKSDLVEFTIALLDALQQGSKLINDSMRERVCIWLKFFKALKSKCHKDDNNPFYEALSVYVNALRLSNCDNFKEYIISIGDWRDEDATPMDLF